MALEDEKSNLFIGKVGGLVFVVIGFLLAASGYRYGSAGYMVAGIVFIAIGIMLLTGKVLRRNQHK
ncbi:hypothetical protein PZN02_002858 [Sinorhizobium garamanticum]|uniref:Uncharacterized protein n=1 Tax=Sinorhizobium garamanticum TaxID=680247 RepID=A0ABY8D6R9_9HYPH|nr:hypothetical protein [Sinorhizobium garamanticum]WEX86559.1 hypothetical protein PZN02_002858 [Sinorhizobium garamanticum]